jgi:uncharacterized SAM-binding protein YcdF (DUF218 family)
MGKLPLSPSDARQLYAFLSAPIGTPRSGSLAMVFGRHDPRPAEAAADLYHRGLVDTILVTGGKGGKDQGALAEVDMSEAAYVFAVLTSDELRVPAGNVIREEQATNGYENCEFSIKLIRKLGLPHERVVLVAHSTQLRRLAEQFKHWARRLDFDAEIAAVPSNYPFDPSDLSDQEEAITEMRHLIEWPNEGKLDPQELPKQLVQLVPKE